MTGLGSTIAGGLGKTGKGDVNLDKGGGIAVKLVDEHSA